MYNSNSATYADAYGTRTRTFRFLLYGKDDVLAKHKVAILI